PSPGIAAPPLFIGRIVDENGRAVSGASVLHIPTSWQREKLGLSFGALAPPLDLSRLASTQSRSDGRFAFVVTDHAPDPDAPPPGGEGWHGCWDDVPCLLVLHPDFEARLVRCTGWRGRDFDAGDVALVAGAEVSGRAVDERGLPLADVSVAVPAFDENVDEARRGEWY